MLKPSCLYWLDKRVIHTLNLFLGLLNNGHLVRWQVAYNLLVFLVKPLFFIVNLWLCRLWLCRLLFDRWLLFSHFRDLIELWLILRHELWILLDDLHQLLFLRHPGLLLLLPLPLRLGLSRRRPLFLLHRPLLVLLLLQILLHMRLKGLQLVDLLFVQLVVCLQF